VFSRLKNVFSRLKNLWRLSGIYSPFEKLAVIEPLGIPDTSGINTVRIAPTVTRSVALRGVETPNDCWNSRLPELPTLVGTPDERNSRAQRGCCG
jgi:hypothetical protein